MARHAPCSPRGPGPSREQLVLFEAAAKCYLLTRDVLVHQPAWGVVALGGVVARVVTRGGGGMGAGYWQGGWGSGIGGGL